MTGFDWTTFVDSMMDLERAPAARMEREKISNQTRLNAITALETRLVDLRSAVTELNQDGVFDARAATASAAGWSATAENGAAAGRYTFAVTQTATTSRLQGAADLGAPIAASDDVSGVTLSNLGAGLALTPGEFTINGARIAVDLADSLQDLFDKIATGTGGAVSASYDSATDRISLSSASPIVLGAANDSSNFLTAARLANNGTGSIASSTALGALNASATLSAARFGTALSPDGDGAGSFKINGVAIDFNVNSDSLNAVVARINASSAGVTASYDPVADRLSLANTATGDLGISFEDTAGGLLGALGLTSGATLARGRNALFTVNDGAPLVSASNTLSAASHGIPGLAVTASAEGTSTVTVAADSAGMREKIDTFITRFNAVQSYIDDQTRVTSTNGKVNAATLSSNREVQNWSSALRSAAFAAVPGLGASINRLDHLGIDFTSGTSNLVVKDAAKLETALRERSSEVSAFFRQASTGFTARLEGLFTSYLGSMGSGGLLGTQKTNLTKANDLLTQQITDLDRRLAERRTTLEAAFIAMESAQARINQMQTQLSNAFPNPNASSKK